MLTLQINDEDILEKLSQYAISPEEQESTALYAIRLGLDAMAFIRGEMDKQALQEVGESVIVQMQGTLEAVLEADREEVIRTLREEIARLSERRSLQRLVTQGGGIFENDLGGVLQVIAHDANDIFESTGLLTGNENKVGDFIVVLGDGCHAPGEKIVIEAKRDKSYTLTNILDECKTARINREAQVCIFVWDRESSRGRVPPLRRHKNDIIVLWDAADDSTNIYLDAAYWLAKSLVAPKRGERQVAEYYGRQLLGNFERVMQQVEMLETIRLSGERIRLEGLAIRKNCVSILEVLRETIDDIKQDIEALTQVT